ncbi:hypothetical protein PI125_g16142 [Phytophthora idaei]|nr:hypothetical protein PI125_g16142 [Phytophthora idaei]
MPVKLHQPTKLPKRTKDPKTISTRAASVGQGKNEAPLVPKPSSGVEIQCMRMRKLLAAKALDTPPLVISTVEELSYQQNAKQDNHPHEIIYGFRITATSRGSLYDCTLSTQTPRNRWRSCCRFFKYPTRKTAVKSISRY